MPHSRDVRTHASEIKFVVSTELAARIRQWKRTHLDPDPHGSGPFGDEYQTTSIYFDTGGLDVFHRRGSFGRSKYPAGVPFLRDQVILELKFRGVVPAMFRRLVEELMLNPEPASKYRLGLAAYA